MHHCRLNNITFWDNARECLTTQHPDAVRARIIMQDVQTVDVLLFTWQLGKGTCVLKSWCCGWKGHVHITELVFTNVFMCNIAIYEFIEKTC